MADSSISKIRAIESAWDKNIKLEIQEEKKRQAPVFVTRPEAQVVYEGEWARFVCRLTSFPRARVLWIVNGRTVMNVWPLFGYLFIFFWRFLGSMLTCTGLPV